MKVYFFPLYDTSMIYIFLPRHLLHCVCLSGWWSTLCRSNFRSRYRLRTGWWFGAALKWNAALQDLLKIILDFPNGNSTRHGGFIGHIFVVFTFSWFLKHIQVWYTHVEACLVHLGQMISFLFSVTVQPNMWKASANTYAKSNMQPYISQWL